MRRYARRRFGRADRRTVDVVRFALVDVPYAAIRRHLVDGVAPPRAPSRSSSSRRPPACSAPTTPPAPADGVRTPSGSVRCGPDAPLDWGSTSRTRAPPSGHRRSRSAPVGRTTSSATASPSPHPPASAPAPASSRAKRRRRQPGVRGDPRPVVVDGEHTSSPAATEASTPSPAWRRVATRLPTARRWAGSSSTPRVAGDAVVVRGVPAAAVGRPPRRITS